MVRHVRVPQRLHVAIRVGRVTCDGDICRLHNIMIPQQDVIRAPIMGALPGTADRPRRDDIASLVALVAYPRLHHVLRAPLSRVAARADSCLLREPLDERRQRRDVADDDADRVLDDGPDDGGRRVQVVLETLDRLDPDALDEGDEDAHGEEAEEHELLPLLDLRPEENGEREEETILR